jgi:hypothetical protein
MYGLTGTRKHDRPASIASQPSTLRRAKQLYTSTPEENNHKTLSGERARQIPVSIRRLCFGFISIKRPILESLFNKLELSHTEIYAYIF